MSEPVQLCVPQPVKADDYQPPEMGTQEIPTADRIKLIVLASPEAPAADEALDFDPDDIFM